MRKGVLHTVSFILFALVNMKINCATPLLESNGTAAKDIDGNALLNLGRKLNKPMITLFGMAIRNLEGLHRCKDWTQWSECGASKVGYIAAKKRSRNCASRSFSLESETKTTETDITICEGLCPKDYNMTVNGFCVKLYVSGKTFDEAEKQCEKDGGHVMNIDSEMKYGDVKSVLKGFTKHVYIDGHRKDSSSPWLLMNGMQKQFFSWGSGAPDSHSCIYIHYANLMFYDYACTNSMAFLCEI